VEEVARPAGTADPRWLAELLAAEALRQRPGAEAERAQLRDRLEGLLQALGEGVLIADATGRLLWADDAVAALHGHASGETLIAAGAQELDARVEVLDEWGQRVAASRLPLLALRRSPAPEGLLRLRERSNGEERWVMLRGCALRDREGRPLILVALYRDATAQRQGEQALRLLSRAGALLCGPLDARAALQALGRLVLPELGDAAEVQLFAHEPELRWPTRARLSLEGEVEALPALPMLPLERPLLVADPAASDDAGLRALAEAGCACALAVPLQHRGQTLGTLRVGREPSRRRFGTADLALAEDVGSRAAAALEGARRVQLAQALAPGASDERRVLALELSQRIGEALQREERTRAALQICAEAFRRALGARLARVWTCAEHGHVVELQAAASDEPGLPPLEAFEVRRIATSGARRIVLDLSLDSVLAPCGPGSLVGLPLFGGEPPAVLGAMALFFSGAPPAQLEQLTTPALSTLGLGLLRARARDEADRAREQLLEESRRKEAFLAVLAHELRNPLAPIVTALGLMRTREGDGTSVARERALVERQVGQMARLVDDLLDVSRISSGKLELRKEPVDLASVLARAIEAAQPAVARFRHALSVSLPDQSVFLVADPVRLSQVISNLVQNAAKYTPPGGRIRLWAGREGSDAVVRVRDTGIGIPVELQKRVFDLFVQGQGGPEHARGGLGIGLSLVRALVELHGCDVTLISGGPGTGSEFTVRLPALEDRELHIPLPAAPREAPLEAGGKRVLVVDDNRDAAEMLAEALRQWGCEVRVATDGGAALESAEDRKPDVVLLDIGMPGMDGHEVARRLRAHPRLGDVRLVAVTGYGRELDQQQSRAAGFDLHLTKPVELEILQRAIALAPRVADGSAPQPPPFAQGATAPPLRRPR
jgi:signal transduction histidine kinase/ActR/RegA family two-component response regulator